MAEQAPIAAPRAGGGLLLGNLPAFQRDPLGFLQEIAAVHGDFVELRFAYVRAVFVNHPDLIGEVLLRHADSFDKNTRSAAKIRSTCGNSILSGDTPTWRRHRALVQPVFQPRFIEAMTPAIDAHLARMVERWDALAASETPVDLVGEMMDLVMGVAARVLFGDDIDAARLQADLAELIDDTWRRIGSLADPADISPRFHRLAFRRALASVDATAMSLIARRRASGVEQNDLLGRLLTAHGDAGEDGMTDRELRDAAVTLLLAGHETTASAIAWSLYHIALEPGRGLAQADPDMVFRETIRLYPSIWIIERRALRDVEIGPYRIGKGASVLVSPYVLHRHRDFWPDAGRFDPQRFSAEAVAARPRNAFLPFGLGQHRCVGLHLANLIAGRTLAAVNRHFVVHLVQAARPEAAPKITLRHKTPIMARLERRRR